MKRWDFFSGMTLILLLLIGLGAYSMWISKQYNQDVESLVGKNFDTLRAVRALRTSNTRINAIFLSANEPGKFGDVMQTYEHEKKMVLEQLTELRRLVADPLELESIERLDALLKDYFMGMELLKDIPARKTRQFEEQRASLGRLTGEITTVCQTIMSMNDQAITMRKQVTRERGHYATYISLGIVILSIVIYGYISIRLAQGVYKPMVLLRDSIERVRKRNFSELVPVVGKGELAKIAQSFNEMTIELRAYIEEQDTKVVEANRMSRAILNALPKPVYITDENLNVVLLNPRAERFSAALGVPGELPSLVRQAMDTAAAKNLELVDDDLRRAVEVEVEGYDSRTGKRHFLPQVFRMNEDQGTAQGWAVLLMDVTNLRRMDGAKSKAISTLGHEIKTPVTGIRMTLHLLLEETMGILSADQRELLESARDDCERLLAVLQALLELARFESGRVSLKPESTEPIDLVHNVMAMNDSLVRHSDRSFEVADLDETIPNVGADMMHASRVLGNFVSNAVKYATAGTAVRLQVIARSDGYVRFSVINQIDRPIAETELSKMFESFYRRSGETSEGAGLGLTISKEIAALHHGRVGVWSENDQIEFYLDLPVWNS